MKKELRDQIQLEYSAILANKDAGLKLDMFNQKYTVGEQVEALTGKEKASEDPTLAYYRDPYWFQYQDLLAQKKAGERVGPFTVSTKTITPSTWQYRGFQFGEPYPIKVGDPANPDKPFYEDYWNQFTKTLPYTIGVGMTTGVPATWSPYTHTSTTNIKTPSPYSEETTTPSFPGSIATGTTQTFGRIIHTTDPMAGQTLGEVSKADAQKRLQRLADDAAREEAQGWVAAGRPYPDLKYKK